jgi:hypothetical protein
MSKPHQSFIFANKIANFHKIDFCILLIGEKVSKTLAYFLVMGKREN